MSITHIRIGTRGSKLALYQANKVNVEIRNSFPEITTEIKTIKTQGDKILDVALSKIGDKGLFTKELEVALLNGEIDLAVHSLKDMPTELPEGLILGGVLERGEVRDALVTRDGRKLIDLTQDDRIATSSLRRKACLLYFNKYLKIVDIRGNVQTRLQKMQEGYCDAMIMAATGLHRLGLGKNITEMISQELIMPAVGQGAIGIEVRDGDENMEKVMKLINDSQTWIAITAEREFMKQLQGGCQVPVGCYSEIHGTALILNGFVASLDGHQYIREQIMGSLGEAKQLGKKLAYKIKLEGGDAILEKIRNAN